MLALVGEGRVRVCARLDLVDAQQPEQLTGAARSLAATQQATECVLVAFGADRQRCCALLDDAADQLGEVGLPVVEALYADGNRWWSRTCSGVCCPPEGSPYDVSTSPLAAEAVYAGLSVAVGREAITASVAGPDRADWPRLAARGRAIDRAEGRAVNRAGGQAGGEGGRGLAVRQRRMQQLVRSVLEGAGRGVTEDTGLELALLARDVHVRDAAWSMMTAERAPAHVDLWAQVVARCVPELASGPLCLVGVAAWIGGNGTLQMCCVERVRKLDADYSMADLLAELNRRAAPPSLWDQIAPGLRSEIAASSDGDRTKMERQENADATAID